MNGFHYSHTLIFLAVLLFSICQYFRSLLFCCVCKCSSSLYSALPALSAIYPITSLLWHFGPESLRSFIPDLKCPKSEMPENRSGCADRSWDLSDQGSKCLRTSVTGIHLLSQSLSVAHLYSMYQLCLPLSIFVMCLCISINILFSQLVSILVLSPVFLSLRICFYLCGLFYVFFSSVCICLSLFCLTSCIFVCRFLCRQLHVFTLILFMSVSFTIQSV